MHNTNFHFKYETLFQEIDCELLNANSIKNESDEIWFSSLCGFNELEEIFYIHLLLD